ncbi:hypothetical protein [Mycobacterium sp. E1747]|nr:hypothetical protein [Mycobacterium sp. E1747]
MRWVEDGPLALPMLDDDRCAPMMSAFIAEHSDLWHQDIGLAP